jgi:hypothetical protein
MGKICLSHGGSVLCIPNAVLVGLIAAIILGIYMTKSSTIIIPRLEPQAPSIQIQQVDQGDGRYSMAPQPLKSWNTVPEFPPRGGLTSMPINIPTQGLPDSFQSMGVITVDDKVLPLYGRRTLSGSDRWNYYTRTDTYNPVPLPVQFKRRDCMDNVGCDEIMSGESVSIRSLKKDGKTDIYKFDGPKYIPGLL